MRILILSIHKHETLISKATINVLKDSTVWYKLVNILVKPVKIWLTKPMHTNQITDNVQKRKSTFKEIPIEEIANVLPAFKQLSINKPLPKINGLRSLPLFL